MNLSPPPQHTYKLTEDSLRPVSAAAMFRVRENKETPLLFRLAFPNYFICKLLFPNEDDCLLDCWDV